MTFVVKLEIILRGEELNIKNRWENYQLDNIQTELQSFMNWNG